jgi:uncharacterized repeat protein (TIGR03803 family)
MSSGRKIGNASRAGLLLLGAAALAAALLAPIAEGAAASYQVLHEFCSLSGCADGNGPAAGLIIDAEGNLYGTTYYNGLFGLGAGVVFKVAPDGTETVLHDFCSSGGCADGAFPAAGLTIDGFGNLYGTTITGGGASGVVFALMRRPPPFEEYYRYRVLYRFCVLSGCADGAYPAAGLIMDAAGNLYGTTRVGGTSDAGVVFKLAPDRTETVLYNFCSSTGCADGAYPESAGLTMDGFGNLYGTTRGGGTSGAGAVFKLAPDGTETVLYSFCSLSGCADGRYPEAGLIIDAAGNLYGTTSAGGTGAAGFGVVFKVAPDGTETVLYNFCSQGNCVDGAYPVAGLIMDVAGNLYGTTPYGGAGLNSPIGAGVVFKVAPDGTETVLYNFCSGIHCVDGAYPQAGLIMDVAGDLYGTTPYGGAHLGLLAGVVFMVTP